MVYERNCDLVFATLDAHDVLRPRTPVKTGDEDSPSQRRRKRSTVGRALQQSSGEKESEVFGRVLRSRAAHHTRALARSHPQLSAGGEARGEQGMLDITEYNVSTTGAADVSATIDLVAKNFPQGRTLFFPAGTYLLSPNTSRYYLPKHITLFLEDGALLRSGNFSTRILVRSPLLVNLQQHIFDDVPTVPVSVRHGAAGSVNGTTVTATTSEPHGFAARDRFRVSGPANPDLLGFWTVSQVIDKHSFTFSVLHDPMGGNLGSPLLSHASFYFREEADLGPIDTAQAWATPECAHQNASAAPVRRLSLTLVHTGWGAAGASGVDDTHAVQFALDSGAPVRLMQSYAVSRVTIAGGGRVFDGFGHALSGGGTMFGKKKTHIGRGRLNAVLEIKCQSSIIQNINVVASYNGTYTAAVHWYSNSNSLYYVGL